MKAKVNKRKKELIILFAEERKEKIIKWLNIHDRVQVKELSDELNVSQVTIRRDLNELEEKGVLLRTHGGAVSLGVGKRYEPSFEDKADKFKKAKVEIGYKASKLIKDGDTVIIDSGTTTLQIVKQLNIIKNLTFITNSIDVFNEIKQVSKDIEILFIGGSYKHNTRAFVGPLAEKILLNLRVDKAFMGSNGVSFADGFTTPDLKEAHIKEIMIDISREVYMVTDHSKFGQVSFCKFAEIEDVDYLITDKIDDDHIEKFKKAGVEVIS